MLPLRKWKLLLTRYIHLNPTSDGLVKKAGDWPYSSYQEYVAKTEKKLCNFLQYVDIEPERYETSVEERQEYQKELNEIKHLLLE